MELRVLRYFLAVAQYGNMTRAAKELLVSQPAISKQIADLEQELNVALFNRVHHRLTLTEEGKYLQVRAQEIVKLADQTAANIGSDTNVGGTLSIGAGESTGMKGLMKIVGDLIHEYPHIQLHLISGNAQQMEDALEKGTIDFAVLMGNRPPTHFNYLEIAEHNRWGLVLRKNDPLAKKPVITPKDLVGLPLLMSDQALQEHRFQQWWGDLGDAMHIVGTYSLVFNAQLLISQSNLYMITFENLINHSAATNLTFRPLSPTLQETTTIIWKKNIVQSKAAQLFLKQVIARTEASE